MSSIKEDLERAIRSGFDFDGEAVHFETYSIEEACNPCIVIDDLGPIGLPLSSRDARAVIAVSEKAQFYEAETDGNTSEKIRGIWQLEADLVKFDNPEGWEDWLSSEVIPSLCRSFDITDDIIPFITYAPRGLMICETGSKEHPLRWAPLDNEFAIFEIILPSFFAGGCSDFSYREVKETRKPSLQSKTSTSVVGSLAGVRHALKTVEHGYRLSLVYTLCASARVPQHITIPRLLDIEAVSQSIHHVLTAWVQSTVDSDPRVLACNLRHSYTADMPYIRGASLEGADSRLYRCLEPLVRSLQFGLHFARLSFTQPEPASVHKTVLIRDVYDAEGMPVVLKDVIMSTSDLLRRDMAHSDDTPQQQVGGEEAMDVDREQQSNSVAVLLWPKKDSVCVTIGNVYDYAMNTLRVSKHARLTRRAQEVSDALLQCCTDRTADPHDSLLREVILLYRELALEWDDGQLIPKALKACGADRRTNILGTEVFKAVCGAFGWRNLESLYTEAISEGNSDEHRRAMLAELKAMGKETNDADLDSWCGKQQDLIVLSIDKVDNNEIDFLLGIAQDKGSKWLQEVLITHLCGLTDHHHYWLRFLDALRNGQHKIPGMSLTQISRIVSTIVQKVFNSDDLFRSLSLSDNPFPLIKFVILCLDTDNAKTCTLLFDRMLKLVRSPTDHRRPTGSDTLFRFYELLCDGLARDLKSVPERLATPVIRRFFKDVLEVELTHRPARLTGVYDLDPWQPGGHGNITTTADTAFKHCGPDQVQTLRDQLSGQQMKALSTPNHAFFFERLIVKVLDPYRELLHDDEAKRKLQEIIDSCLDALVDRMVTTTRTGLDKSANHKKPKIGTLDDIRHLLRVTHMCVVLRRKTCYERLLDELLIPPKPTAHIHDYMVVLLRFLQELHNPPSAAHTDFTIDLAVDSTKSFGRGVVLLFLKVQGAKPSEVASRGDIEALGCGCRVCDKMTSGLSSDQRIVSLKENEACRRHLERRLASRPRFGLTWETIESDARPYTLQIKKSKAMMAPHSWKLRQARGTEIIEKIFPSEDMRKSIFGHDYERVNRIFDPSFEGDDTDDSGDSDADAAGQGEDEGEEEDGEEHNGDDDGHGRASKRARLTY